VFKGETLRSMLLNAYGWWKVSQITYIAALVAFGLGGLTLIGSVFALALGRRPEITHEAIPATGTHPGSPGQDRLTRLAQHPGTLAEPLPPAGALTKGAGRRTVTP
jgi:hypothetical protein